uniref:Uncharacterized protein n=1 Tax=Tanacetum cinerariifolium TaxID=118510 RepID=A0A699GXK0_TANCI|nr:hypothetical protein [Tanacetum cinerariifolium]
MVFFKVRRSTLVSKAGHLPPLCSSKCRRSKAQLATNAPVAEDMNVKVVIGPAKVLLGAVQAGAFKMGDITGTRCFLGIAIDKNLIFEEQR